MLKTMLGGTSGGVVARSASYSLHLPLFIYIEAHHLLSIPSRYCTRGVCLQPSANTWSTTQGEFVLNPYMGILFLSKGHPYVQEFVFNLPRGRGMFAATTPILSSPKIFLEKTHYKSTTK